MKSAVLALFFCIPVVLSAQEESPTPVQYDVVGSFSFADYGYTPSFSPLSDIRVGDFDSSAAWDLAFDRESPVLFVLNRFPAALTSIDVSDPHAMEIAQKLEVAGLSAEGLALDGSVLAVAGAADADTFEARTESARGFVYLVAVSDITSVQTAEEAEEAGVYLELDWPIFDVALRSGRVAALGAEGLYLADVEDLLAGNAAGGDAWTRLDLEIGADEMLSQVKVEFSAGGDTVYASFPAANRVVRINAADGTLLSDGDLGLKDFADARRPVAQPNRAADAGETRPVGIDPSDRDGTISILPAPITGRFEPLDFAVIDAGGRELLVSANGGVLTGIDASAAGAGARTAVRVEEAQLDAELEDELEAGEGLDSVGRLFVVPSAGGTDNDGDIDRLVASGARSFSIFDHSLSLVFDSWDLIEHLVATIAPFTFNASPYSTRFDAESPTTGPGPSAVAGRYMGEGRVLVAVGLRSPGGVMFFRVRLDTGDVAFLGYKHNRNWDMALTEEGEFRFPERAGHLGPRRMIFLDPDADAGRPNLVLAVANHNSGTVELYEETSPYYWE